MVSKGFVKLALEHGKGVVNRDIGINWIVECVHVSRACLKANFLNAHVNGAGAVPRYGATVGDNWPVAAAHGVLIQGLVCLSAPRSPVNVRGQICARNQFTIYRSCCYIPRTHTGDKHLTKNDILGNDSPRFVSDIELRKMFAN